jgi:hypothetical protein
VRDQEERDEPLPPKRKPQVVKRQQDPHQPPRRFGPDEGLIKMNVGETAVVRVDVRGLKQRDEVSARPRRGDIVQTSWVGWGPVSGNPKVFFETDFQLQIVALKEGEDTVEVAVNGRQDVFLRRLNVEVGHELEPLSPSYSPIQAPSSPTPEERYIEVAATRKRMDEEEAKRKASWKPFQVAHWSSGNIEGQFQGKLWVLAPDKKVIVAIADAAEPFLRLPGGQGPVTLQNRPGGKRQKYWMFGEQGVIPRNHEYVFSDKHQNNIFIVRETPAPAEALKMFILAASQVLEAAGCPKIPPAYTRQATSLAPTATLTMSRGDSHTLSRLTRWGKQSSS